jgi:plasmid stabilization system protein ParE
MDKALSLFNDHRHFWLLPRLGYSEQALADLDGLTDFLIETDFLSVVETVGLIEEAVALRVRHPMIGRPSSSAEMRCLFPADARVIWRSKVLSRIRAPL